MDALLAQGQVILGKYRVERAIGKGAMGAVFSARHIKLDDRVAIKVLLPEMLTEPGVLDRFLREAKAARCLKSEHVARVIDVGELESGAPYIIMEYLEGKDLAKIRSERGSLEVEEAVDYVIQACDAIAEAHSQGIIHRDLKPANLFLTRRTDGSALIKVLDFGTSKILPKEADASLEMTHTGMAIGSPSYMAPEQMLSSRSADARADIWALGVVLYNLLTGTFPFRAETLLQMCAAVIQSPPTPPSNHRGDLPPTLSAVILKCLKKKPDDRFPDAAALARALLPFATAETRYIVERIERVLGVTSDLAPFLAPSIRGAQLSPPDEGEGATRDRADSSREAGGDEPMLASKALTTTQLATLVRSGRARADATSEPSAASEPSTKRATKTFVFGAAALAACVGVALFLSSSSSPGPSPASAYVRALDTAAAISVEPAEAPVATSPAKAPSDEPDGGDQDAASASTRGPQAGLATQRAPTAQNASARSKRDGREPRTAASRGDAPATTAESGPAAKPHEPAPPPIPDDR